LNAVVFARKGTTFFSAGLARLSTSPAMIYFCGVFGAFFSTKITHLRTQLAHCSRLRHIYAHHLGYRATHSSALSIELNTSQHLLDISLVQAGCSAILTGDGAIVTRLNTVDSVSCFHE
jgi:hypothetical protein